MRSEKLNLFLYLWTGDEEGGVGGDLEVAGSISGQEESPLLLVHPHDQGRRPSPL